MQRKSVDFPAPDGPMIETNSPASTLKLTLFNTFVSELYVLPSSSTVNKDMFIGSFLAYLQT